MKAILILCVIFGAILCCSSCKKEKEATEYPYKAEVVGEACGLYTIQITEGQKEVALIDGQAYEGNSIYIAKNLPDELKISGLKIILNVRKPENNELGSCTDMGISYPWIFVTKAKKE